MEVFSFVMTPIQFYDDTKGKAIDFDGAYGVQCHDLAQYYCYRLDIPRDVIQCKLTNYAIDIWTRRNDSGIRNYFDIITDPSQLKDGDMVVFPPSYANTPLSHVCFYYDFGGKTKYAFGQRQGGNREARLITTLDFKQMAGAFRPKVWSQIKPGKHRGCDVSEWQNPVITDISGYEFVIIRAGWGINKDKQVDAWIKKCEEELHIPYGLYWYSYATSVESAQNEARTFLETIKNYNPKMGLWLDMEDADHYKEHKIGTLTGDKITPITVAFMEVLDTANLYCGIYASQSWFGNLIQTEPTKAWDKWVANWGPSNSGEICVDTSYLGTMLQYTSAGGLDKDITYIDLDVYDIHKNDQKPEKEDTQGDSTTTEAALRQQISDLKNEVERLRNVLNQIKILIDNPQEVA